MLSLIASHYLHVYGLDLSKLDIVLTTDTEDNETLRLSESEFFKESFRHPEIVKLLIKHWDAMRLEINTAYSGDMDLKLFGGEDNRVLSEYVKKISDVSKQSCSHMEIEYYVEVPVLVLKGIGIPTALPKPRRILR